MPTYQSIYLSIYLLSTYLPTYPSYLPTNEIMIKTTFLKITTNHLLSFISRTFLTNISFLEQIGWSYEWLLVHSFVYSGKLSECSLLLWCIFTTRCYKLWHHCVYDFSSFIEECCGVTWFFPWTMIIIDTFVGKEQPSCHEMAFRTSLWPCPLAIWVPHFEKYVMVHA